VVYDQFIRFDADYIMSLTKESGGNRNTDSTKPND
jgi:hypothetical protein